MLPESALRPSEESATDVTTLLVSGDTVTVQVRWTGTHRESYGGVPSTNRPVDVRVNKSGCLAQCGHGPMIAVYPENVWYAGVKLEDVTEIVERHLARGEVVQRLLFRGHVAGPNVIKPAC